MDYDDITDWENDSFETLTEGFIEKYKDEWDIYVADQFEGMLLAKSDFDYDRWKDDQLEAEQIQAVVKDGDSV